MITRLLKTVIGFVDPNGSFKERKTRFLQTYDIQKNWGWNSYIGTYFGDLVFRMMIFWYSKILKLMVLIRKRKLRCFLGRTGI